MTPKPYRILVTGSRTWTDYLVIENALHDACFAAQETPGWTVKVIVVHGKCLKGADAIADAVARDMREAGLAVETEPHPADWKRYNWRAGMIRNAEMVALGADLCLAFMMRCRLTSCDRRGPHGTHGASHCADLAEKAGIKTVRFTDG